MVAPLCTRMLVAWLAPASMHTHTPRPHLNQGLPGFLFPSVVDGGAPGTGTLIITDS